MRRVGSRLTDAVILTAVVAGGYFGYLHRYDIGDWYVLRDYTPPAPIVALADQATMTEAGRHLFYRGQPSIEITRDDLVRDCHVPSAKTIELGCFLSLGRIYLLDIKQPDLKNEMIVTAAHETLHAAYQRMSDSEKQQINPELEKYAATITDNSFKQRILDYRKTEPGQEDNELHSIIGTEYPNLPPVLEQYYAKYFSKRAQIVTYSLHFTQTFDGLHAEIVQLDARIKATKTQMDGLKAAGRVREYNALVSPVNTDINSYNAKVEQYNQYASDLLGTQSIAGTQ